MELSDHDRPILLDGEVEVLMQGGTALYDQEVKVHAEGIGYRGRYVG